ncbi:MAG TPA: lysophospholipid acyltransferase family protein [Anaeromyxobacteraceae bacterium]|nr:lysophospholipid acyltransferase family protein [Anaeromyxobacteraceae bacterium]
MPLAAAARAAARVGRMAALAAEAGARGALAGRGGAEAEVRRARARLLRDVFRRALALHGIAAIHEGPLPDGPAVLVSNHLSYLDPIALGALVPCVPISKAELSRWPVFGPVARRLGVLFVDRGDRLSGVRVMRAAERALEQGIPVLNFPEGTTTTGANGVLAFRRGLFGLARRARVPVVPVALRYEPGSLAWVGDATFAPHYLRLAALERSTVHVRFGAPVPSLAHPGAAELAEAVRARIASLLEPSPDRAATGSA